MIARWWPPRRLFWRVYASSLLVLVTTALAMGVASQLSERRPRLQELGQRLGRLAAAELGPALGDPERLQDRLEMYHHALQVDLAVYTHDGQRLAVAGTTLPPLRHAGSLRRAGLERREGAWVVALDRSTYLMARKNGSHPGGRALLFFAVILGVAAAASIPLTRAVVRPLERLTTTANRLGEGQLTVRSDLTRRDEIGQLGLALDDMARRIQRLRENERQLLADLSHELRTPLARLRVALELAEESEDATLAQSHIVGMGDDLKELEQLLQDVFTMAKLDRKNDGSIPLRKQSTTLNAVADAARARFVQRHPDFTLTVQGPSAIPIHGDPALLRRVMDNLLDNAARYGRGPDATVDVALAGEGPTVRLEVCDRGPGVAPDDRERIFDPFYRADKSRARSAGGVGLGLALCKRIVVAHGGAIGVHPRAGGGAVFWVTLPTARLDTA